MSLAYVRFMGVFAPHVPHTTSRALSSEDGPRKDFTAFMEWTLPESTPASGSTSAPSSLASTVTRLSISSTWVLSHSGSGVIWISASVARALGSTLAPWILGIHLACWLSALGSSTTCSAAVGRPPGVGGNPSSIAPPSVGSTVGHHHGCGLDPAVLLLLRAPPVSSLAPLTFITPLDSLCHPPPGCPSSSCASSLVPTRPCPLDVSTVQGRTFREGALCQVYGLVCVFTPHVLRDPVSVSHSLSFGSGVSSC